MAIVEPLSPTPDGHRRLGLRSTSNNEPIHEITVNTQEDVAAALVRARAAQKLWAKVPIAERARIVRGMGGVHVMPVEVADLVAVAKHDHKEIPRSFLHKAHGRFPAHICDTMNIIQPRVLPVRPKEKLLIDAIPLRV